MRDTQDRVHMLDPFGLGEHPYIRCDNVAQAYAILRAASAPQNKALIDGKWVPSVPIPGPLDCRIRDAWAVLCGKAEIVRE
jgi:hypothetical protein